MAIIGAHMLLYSPEPDALRATLRDAFGFESVDAGSGWLIFALPPSELGVHSADSKAHHEVSFLCEDIHATIAELRAKGMQIDGEPEDRRSGIAPTMILPGDVKVMLYEPRHPLAITPTKRTVG